ncbi:pro-neuregulin-1, membrane-bound isoform [Pseudoliparis swirei]|uniref:pro-neuregulin-1, membrane-bound isoform n=1 Tax=Pseudoliparis swirei TaxID=2059687 RepID=UPI0024BE2B92|nr:pro-neuregulin-1, membrane-bound isoform [Pseudoliparis swirei]
MDQMNGCLHSEKICILPLLACLLSLALCTAGLKWVFVDKIFQYDPPTHLDPKRIGQDPILISVTPTLGLAMSTPQYPALSSLSTASTPGGPGVLAEERSTPPRPSTPEPPRGTRAGPSVTLKYSAGPEQTPPPRSERPLNDIIVPTIAATSTTTTAKTSSHVTRCSDRQRNYCVNGGKCFTLEILPGTTKFLCRCPNEFTGDRCQKYVMASFYKHLGIEFMEAEELYQKRILTITGICIALLVVGVMCVVAYCKTKKQRKKLHDHLRQSLRKKKRNNNNNTNLTSSARGRQGSGLPLQDLQLQDLQLTDRCVGPALRDGETETNLSTSKKALLGHEPSASTDMSVKSWTNDWGSSLLSDTESVSVMSLPENSQRAAASQGGRGRLYATGGGGRDLSAHSEKC